MFDSTHWKGAPDPDAQGEEASFSIITPLPQSISSARLIALLENGGFSQEEETTAMARAAQQGPLGGGMGQTCELIDSLSAQMGFAGRLIEDEPGPGRSSPVLFIPATGTALMSGVSDGAKGATAGQLMHVMIDVAWATKLLERNTALLRKLEEYMRKSG
jgi:hypothetical protein